MAPRRSIACRCLRYVEAEDVLAFLYESLRAGVLLEDVIECLTAPFDRFMREIADRIVSRLLDLQVANLFGPFGALADSRDIPRDEVLWD